MSQAYRTSDHTALTRHLQGHQRTWITMENTFFIFQLDLQTLACLRAASHFYRCGPAQSGAPTHRRDVGPTKKRCEDSVIGACWHLHEAKRIQGWQICSVTQPTPQSPHDSVPNSASLYLRCIFVYALLFLLHRSSHPRETWFISRHQPRTSKSYKAAWISKATDKNGLTGTVLV